MSDRELLELAARVAGIDGEWRFLRGEGEEHGWFSVKSDRSTWNPLANDGEALRLANRLGICIEFTTCEDDAPVVRCGPDGWRDEWPTWPNFPDSGAATRRAIVVAAAEIGKAMP